MERPLCSGQIHGVGVGVGVGVRVGVGVAVGVGVMVGVAVAVEVGVGEGVRVAVAVAGTEAAETEKIPGSPVVWHPANTSNNAARPMHHHRHIILDMQNPIPGRLNRASVTLTALASIAHLTCKKKPGLRRVLVPQTTKGSLAMTYSPRGLPPQYHRR